MIADIPNVFHVVQKLYKLKKILRFFKYQVFRKKINTHIIQGKKFVLFFSRNTDFFKIFNVLHSKLIFHIFVSYTFSRHFITNLRIIIFCYFKEICSFISVVKIRFETYFEKMKLSTCTLINATFSKNLFTIKFQNLN